MHQSVSSMLQLVEHDTPCPNLLRLDVQFEPAEQHALDMLVSLTCGSFWHEMAGGRVRVAIAQAQLSVDLLQMGFSPADMQESFVDLAFAIHPVSSDPFCAAILPESGAVLEGDVEDFKIGMLQPTGSGSQVTVTVTAAPRDIRITEAEGFWRHDITPNKLGIIERKLALTLHEALLSAHLSCMQWGASGTAAPATPARSTLPNPIDEASLTHLLRATIEAPTSNVLELAQRAELVIETDLAGASFRGGSLYGLDLSSVDLSYANLRGADLTDAELSEANLTHAKLGGADLSGADLGSANFRDADLHRASLALANLSGADLRGADLRETNLSQTNLNGVLVQGARFSYNTGLSDDQKAELIERGAIAEDE